MKGFTLIELIMIILLLGVLAVTAVVRWPSGMKEAAAVGEFKRAVRYAQHKAMTREFFSDCATGPWGIFVDNSSYTVKRYEAACADGGSDEHDPEQCAEADYRNRLLNNDSGIALTIYPGGLDESSKGVWFNGLGEPIDSDNCRPLPEESPVIYFTIGGGSNLVVCPETGYVQEGTACP